MKKISPSGKLTVQPFFLGYQTWQAKRPLARLNSASKENCMWKHVFFDAWVVWNDLLEGRESGGRSFYMIVAVYREACCTALSVRQPWEMHLVFGGLWAPHETNQYCIHHPGCAYTAKLSAGDSGGHVADSNQWEWLVTRYTWSGQGISSPAPSLKCGFARVEDLLRHKAVLYAIMFFFLGI